MKKQDAIDHYRTVGKLAKALRITRHAIYQWDHDTVPIRQAMKLEKLTKGALKVQAKMYE